MLDDEARREIEARYPHAKAMRRATERERRVRGFIRWVIPYVIVIIAFIGFGFMVGAIERIGTNVPHL